MRKHLQYAKYVIRHKAFVFYAGLKTGAPLWRLLIHDWSKMTPAEWNPYVVSFYGPKKRTPETRLNFERAFLHHLHHNPHHWQHWVNVNTGRAMEMPLSIIREMVADWMGAGRAITGYWDVKEWYLKNSLTMNLAPATQSSVEELIRTTEI